MSFYARGISPLVPVDNDPGTIFTEPTITQQHFKSEVNINNIIAKFNRTGILGDGEKAVPRYADVSLFGDFSQCQARIQEGKNAFQELPLEVRKLAGNDPARLWDVLQNPENREILVNAGVLEPRKKPESQKDSGSPHDQNP